jgi:hypothetical protein
MKQLIILILLVGGGYYLYNNGFLKVFSNAKLSPKEFLSDVKNAASNSITSAAGASRTLPEKAPERSLNLSINKAGLTALENAVFASYDSRAAYALAELVYGAGLSDGDRVINRYLSAFTLAEEKNRILTLLGRYRDRESFEMLLKYYNRGTFSRKTLLRKLADFKSPEAAEFLTGVLNDNNAALRAAAEAIVSEVSDEPWYENYKTRKQPLPSGHLQELMSIPLSNP